MGSIVHEASGSHLAPIGAAHLVFLQHPMQPPAVPSHPTLRSAPLGGRWRCRPVRRGASRCRGATSSGSTASTALRRRDLGGARGPGPVFHPTPAGARGPGRGGGGFIEPAAVLKPRARASFGHMEDWRCSDSGTVADSLFHLIRPGKRGG